MNILKLLYLQISLLFLIVSFVNCAPNDLLEPQAIEPYMFTTEIDGTIPILTPQQKKNKQGEVIQESYTIFMEKKQLQVLPSHFGKTTLYCYGGNVKGQKLFSYPGPGIIGKTKVPTYVKYVNNLDGPHILPVDFSHPFAHHFTNITAFRQQVPVIPHLHGGITEEGSDGYPEAYWTKSGFRGPKFSTLNNKLPSNMALFRYTNEAPHGLLWYHDHAIGITRLNAYAGLAGYYEIINPRVSRQEKNIYVHYGRIEKKYFVITDKSFKQSGQLFYPDQADNPEFQTWVPQFFGNTILVNGVVWPKITLENKKYRMVFLNACGSRFLDINFEGVNGTKLPFDLIRADSDYFEKPITVNSYFIDPSGRIEIIIDFSQNIGTVILKNTANVPHPAGDQNTLIPKFTGTVLKINVQEKFNRFNFFSSCKASSFQASSTAQNYTHNALYSHQKHKYIMYSSDYYHLVSACQIKKDSFPTLPKGKSVYYTFIETTSPNGQVSGVFIDGISFSKSEECVGRTFDLNQIYDIHFINLTPDSHPLHMHIVNFQKIAVIPFDVQAYRQAFFAENGAIPSHGYHQFPNVFAPDKFYLGNSLEIQPIDKVFRDVTTVLPGHVTIIRVKFANNDGCSFKTSVKGQFVFHCHILQHQDNDMMNSMCIQ